MLAKNLNTKKDKNGLDKFLNFIERAGNTLPHPFILFVYIIIALAIISAVVSLAGVEVVNPASKEVIKARNLLSAEGLRWFVQNAI